MNPGPKPSAKRSYAWRVVSDVGSLLASVKANRMEKSGTARTTNTVRATIPDVHGRRWIMRLQRYQKLSGVGVAPVCRSLGRCKRSMARPAKPSMAGSNVKAAAITSTTAAIVPTASPWRNGSCRRKRPSKEMTTVVPANSTARPDVASAVATAWRGSRPSNSPCRYRVTMNRA